MTAQATSAFPNAYLEVDEPPKRIAREKILALIALVGIAYLGLTTLVLHFEPTGYDPLRQVVSDYAVGSFALEMELGFFAGGVGLVALGRAISLANPGRIFKVGSSLLFIAGLCLLAVGAFPTDVEGAAITLHGTIHSILSQFVFIFGPIGMLLISYGYDRRSFWPTLLAFIAAGGFFAADMVLSLDVTGLAERVFLLVLLSWEFTIALRLLRSS
jgi:hypothetical membrane protein